MTHRDCQHLALHHVGVVKKGQTRSMIYQCDRCGAHLRDPVVMMRDEVDDWYSVGRVT